LIAGGNSLENSLEISHKNEPTVTIMVLAIYLKQHEELISTQKPHMDVYSRYNNLDLE
jgi:hypothetical protein